MASQRSRRVRFSQQNQNDTEPITAETLTSEIRTCYDTVDKGRMLLGRLYDKLRQHDDDSETLGSFRRNYQLLIELDNLKDVLVLIAEKRSNYIRQLEKAQDIVWNDRREMKEFLRMKKATDRRLQEKMKIFSRFSEQPENLVTELQENSQILSELLNELKEQLVAEEQFINTQLVDGNRDVDDAFSISPRDRWYYIRGKRPKKVEWERDDPPRAAGLPRHDYEAGYLSPQRKPNRESEPHLLVRNGEKASTDSSQTRSKISSKPRDIEERTSRLLEKDPLSDERKIADLYNGWGGERSPDECDTSSLSQKLKDLVKQSENVQQLISNSSRKVGIDTRNTVESFGKDDQSQPLLPTEYLKKSAERETDAEHGPAFIEQERDSADIPTRVSDPAETKESAPRSKLSKEGEVAERSARNGPDTLRKSFENVLQKCEEVERKMQGFSPKEVREKLLHNLDELDKADQDMDRILLTESSPRHRVYRCKTRVDHGHIRQEFVKCLDKIFAIEKCYGSAGDEIRNLKRELELALRGRDAVEHSLRGEIEKLKEKLQLRANDVDFYRGRVHDLKKEFFGMKAKYESELDSKEQVSKDTHVGDFKSLKDECEQLKVKVDRKSNEVDELRKELEKAINEIHALKGGPSKREKTAGRTSMDTAMNLEGVILSLRGSSHENISEELVALQRVVEIAEENERKSWEEIASLREENSHLTEENSNLSKENRKLKNRIEELDLALLRKSDDIENLSKRGMRNVNGSSKETYDSDLRLKEEECQRLKKRLGYYESLLAKDGQDLSVRLDDIYEEYARSLENINKEKEILEEDFQQQRLMYEDLLAQCHNEISELSKKEQEMEKIMSNFQPDKREILETLLTSVQNPEELAEILSRDLEDGTVEERNLVSEIGNLQKENAKLELRVEGAEEEVATFKKESESLKMRNKELKDKCDHLKSENYLLARIRQDDGQEKLKTYKELLGKKEAECFRLRRILDESIDYEERDELLQRLREVHRELLRGGTTNEELSLEDLQESLEKRDREVRRLKRQNKLLAESLGLDEERRKSILDTILDSKEDSKDDYKSDLLYSQEKIKIAESENRILKRQISEKLEEVSRLDDEVKKIKKKLKQSEDQCQALEDQNFSLQERSRALQGEIKELSFVSGSRQFSKASASDDIVKENEYLNEKMLLKDLENERLTDEINSLRADLRRHEVEVSDLKERLVSNAEASDELVSLKQENVEKDEILKDLSKKLGVVEKERKKINEAYIKQKVKNEEDTKHMSDQIKKLQNEIARVTSKSTKSNASDSLNVSHESLPLDEKDGAITRYDRNRLIKKLQEENHQQSAKILSLEEETTAITKIIADMERGHGHLTGMLRGHLVLQKEATAKLLEKSLQQYSDEFESYERKFRAIEDKYDKNRKHLTRRRFAWDLFENATATVDNITAILEEGLIKVEDDLHDEFSSDEDFETRDYKSRIWLLRRRLDDVEKRYRDLMLRAEELSVRLDAKTAEYDVTQDELEDATRVLEVNEITLARLNEELSASVKENARLKGIMSQLKENQELTVGAVIAENEQLKKEIDKAAEDRTEIDALQLEIKNLRDKLKLDDFEVREMRRRLHEQERREKEAIDGLKEKGREEARRYEEEASKLQSEVKVSKKKIGESTSRVSELENQLRRADEKISNLEKYLQKARSSCRSDGIDHHSTIHMLRDDLKKLFKENEGLKDELSQKQKKITALAKDLREAKITVREQLGTERSLNEKMLDRAAKDQMMALKRRIKVLEMENAKLIKKASNLERDQSLGETTKKKNAPATKSNLRGKEESSSSIRNDDDDDKTESSSKIADDTVKSVSSGIFGNGDQLDNSLASIESFKDFSSENREEIEIRDNLIRELEGRIRELKQELAKEAGEKKISVRNRDEDTSKRVDNKTVAEKDVEMLKRENAKLKDSLEKQKDLPISHQVKQKDDVIKRLRAKLGELESEIDMNNRKLSVYQKELMQMREKLGDDWKTKEIVLLDSEEYKELEKQRARELKDLRDEIAKLEATCEDQRNTIDELEKARKGAQVGEEDIQAVLELSVEGALQNFPETDSGVVDSTSKRVPKYINITKAVKEQSTSDSSGEKGKSLSRIPFSPRLKQTRASPSNVEAKNELERKVEEQDDDIRTLLQSVDYFEKEVKKKSEEVDSLKEKLKNSGIEIRQLKVNNAKMQNQLKEATAQDEKLQILEDNVKRLNTENKNLEQQMKKYRRGESERTKSPTELSSRKIANLEKELNNTKKLLEMTRMQIGLFKYELGMGDMNLSDDEKKAKKSIGESMQKRIRKERTTVQSDARKKTELVSKENEKLRTELKEKTISLEKNMNEILALKANLGKAEKERKKVDSELEKSNDRLKWLEAELDNAKARNIALEAIQDAVAHSDNLQEDDKRGQSAVFFGQLNSAWSDLKGLVKNIFVISEEDLISSTASVEEIAGDIERMKSLLGNYSKRFTDELGEQRKTNVELESRVEEFRKIVEETSSRISELEEEVSEKDKSDEIGHQLLLDQIGDLRKKVEKCEKDKRDIEEEVERRDEYIERLTGQVKVLEKQIAQRETENSQLTERALDGEEELESLKGRIEELEDDYNRLLQHGMKLDDEGEKTAVKEESEESLKKLIATIESLKQDKSQLEAQVEELTLANEEMNKFGEDEGKELLEDTIHRLELDKEDLQNKVGELLAYSGKEDDILKAKVEESEKKVKSLEDAMFRLELEKATLQKAYDEAERGDSKENKDMKTKVAELEDENLRMEEVNYQLDVEREGLRKRIDKLTSDERKGDINDLTLLLIDNEEKIADLEQEKKILQAKQENLEKIMDDILQSPRSDEEEDGDENRELLKGGPQSWKRRLIAALKELREKSTELVMMKMIVESKNVEVEVLSKEISEESTSEGLSSLSEDERSLRKNTHKQLKATVLMLQEEIKLKTAEINSLKSEISSLQNEMELQDGRSADGVTWRVNGKREDDIKNEELQKEIDGLRSKLGEKEEQYEALCDQLFGGEPIVTSMENDQLKREIENLKDSIAVKDRERAEIEENYDLVYNELTRMKADFDSDAAQTDGADISKDKEKIKQLEKSLEEYEEAHRIMTEDFNELEEKYGAELNYASTHIGQLMLQVSELEGQLETMHEMKGRKSDTKEEDQETELIITENKLKNTEDELRRKSKLVTNLKETLSNIYENIADQSGERFHALTTIIKFLYF